MKETPNVTEEAVEYRGTPSAGRLAITATKPAATQRDLSLAYVPRVAAVSRHMAQDGSRAFRYATEGDLVAVVTDGSAMPGLDDPGPVASRSIMEVKAIQLKKPAYMEVYGLELDCRDLDELVAVVDARTQEAG